VDAGDTVSRRQAPRGCARGDERAVVGDALSVIEHDGLAGYIEFAGAAAEAQVELERREVLGLRQGNLLGFAVAAQDLLG
jgi:hypothetical protein